MSVLPQLAYEAAVRALDQQERAIADLVQRTTALLAASSLAASFLGGQAISRAKEIELSHYVAILALVVSTSVAAYLLGPKPSVAAGIRASRIARRFGSLDDEVVLMRVAVSLERIHERNEERLVALRSMVAVVAVGLLVQIVSWTLALAGTLG